MWLRLFLTVTLFFGATLSALAHEQNYELEGDYLYRVTTVRAEAGSFEELLDWFADIKASDYFKKSGDHPPFIMRHSQGDQWDLMLILPMESWESFYSPKNSKARKMIGKDFAATFEQGLSKVAFAEELYAYGPDLESFKTAYNENDLYHIEMFHAAAGKTAELYKQRQMENAYLTSTGQTANMIFRRAGGSDVDVFTIGFHESLKSFAADAPATPKEKEVAAKAAGFKNRADLSFYLRSLLTKHHDTFATKVD